MKNRKEILSKFFSDNPTFTNPEGHHRRLADWQYDTKYRAAVDSGEKSFEDALNASRDTALEMLPLPGKSTESAQEIIAEIRQGRNQPTLTAPGGERLSDIETRETVEELRKLRGQK